VEFWIENAEWEKILDDFDIVLGELQEQFLSGVIDDSDLRSELNRLDLPAAAVDNLIERLQKKKIRQRKIPTKQELIDFLKAGIIEDEIFFQRMRLLGYSDKDTRLFMTYILISRETVTRKFLDDEIYQKWYLQKILTLEDLESIFIAKNYSTLDVERLLQEAREQYEQLQK
jgi:hypothetical protein